MTMPVESANKPASPPPEKNDRFRAEMPHIPGVGNLRLGASTNASKINATRLLQIGGLAAFVLLIGGVFLWRVKSAPRGAAESPSPEAAAALSVPAPTAPASGAPDTDGPTVAATAEELAKPWSAKQFTFVKPLTHEKVDAMVMGLFPSRSLWALRPEIRNRLGRAREAVWLPRLPPDGGQPVQQHGLRSLEGQRA
jgi:hypothetical protein